MPIYEYCCKNCGMLFSLQMNMSDHKTRKIVCPECGGQQTVQQYSTFFAKTTKKS